MQTASTGFILWHFTFFVLHLTDANEQTTATPPNVEAVLGKTATLHCHSSIDADIDWKYQLSPTSAPRFIYSNGLVYDVYQTRFKVNKTSPFDYTLIIRDVQFNDSGLYVCIEDAGYGDKHTTLLRVVALPHHTTAERNIGLVVGLAVLAVITVVCILLAVLIIRRRSKNDNNNTATQPFLDKSVLSNESCCRTLIPCLSTSRDYDFAAERRPQPWDATNMRDISLDVWNDQRLLKTIETEYGLRQTLVEQLTVFTEDVVKDIYKEEDQTARVNKLLQLVRTDEAKHLPFLKALQRSDQLHVANYIYYFNDAENPCGDNWPLNEKQRAAINRSAIRIIEFMDSRKKTFLKTLANHHAISKIQTNTLIDMPPIRNDRNAALLEMIKRRSVASFEQFKRCLMKSWPKAATLFTSVEEPVIDLTQTSDAPRPMTNIWADPGLATIVDTEHELRYALHMQSVFADEDLGRIYDPKYLKTRVENILKLVRNDQMKHEPFHAALRCSYQSHVSNYINHFNDVEHHCGDDWPLDERLRKRIRNVTSELVALINSKDESLLSQLADKSRMCITPIQSINLEDMEANRVKRNEKLLSEYLPKRSVANFHALIACLQNFNSNAARLLLDDGGLFIVDADFGKNTAATVKLMESRFRELQTNMKFKSLCDIPNVSLSVVQQSPESKDTLRLIFVCSTLSAVENMKTLLDTNRLKEIIDECCQQLQSNDLKRRRVRHVHVDNECIRRSFDYLLSSAATVDIIRKLVPILQKCVDPQSGLLDALESESIINSEEAARIRKRPTSYAMNDLLLEIVQSKEEYLRIAFMEALKNSGQSHVFNYICCEAGTEDERQIEGNLPLKEEQIRQLQANYSQLVTALDLDDDLVDEFANELKCITEAQTTRIKQVQETRDRARLLLDVMRSRSIADFDKFKSRVMHSTKKWETDPVHTNESTETSDFLIQVKVKIYELCGFLNKDHGDDLLDTLYSWGALSDDEFDDIRSLQGVARRNKRLLEAMVKKEKCVTLIEAMNATDQKTAINFIDVLRRTIPIKRGDSSRGSEGADVQVP